jgi:DNA-directed RNA polymerase subunit M/transcription elongation factor TFIIS
MKIKKCPECGNSMKQVEVAVEDAENKIQSLQCPKCGYFEFDKKTGMKVVKELEEKEQALKIKQKLIKLSHDRLGIYLNKDIIRCMGLKKGENIYISVPNKKKIIIEVG